MKDRRDFLKTAGLLGLAAASSGLQAGCASAPASNGSGEKDGQVPGLARKKHQQQFNMCGYAAPPLETVRIGFIGLGNRGPGAVRRIKLLEGVSINALCDIRPEKASAARDLLKDTDHNPQLYTNGEEDWKNLCQRDDIDLVYIATPWYLHTPMATYAMEQGKHVATEVPAALTLEECWQLVETSEKTRRHCVILENCCYDFFELLTLNMARQGFFGEIIHGEGAYIHDLLEGNFSKTKYYDFWRLKQNFRNANLYPTHGLGPVCKIMNVNRGDRMDYLTAMASNDFMMGPLAEKLAAEDETYRPFAGKSYRGNMDTTLIRTVKGRTIMLQHDVTSPRPYTRIHLISGTQATARKWPLPARIATSHEDWLPEEEVKKLEEQYTPEIIRRIGHLAKQVGGHGGMDFMMDWRLIDCLRNGLPVDHDVYDAALWSSIIPLSEWSIANRSDSIDVPDFTGGAWETNPVSDLSLQKGGNTGVKEVQTT